MVDVKAAEEEGAERGLQSEGTNDGDAAERLAVKGKERPARRLVEPLELG